MLDILDHGEGNIAKPGRNAGSRRESHLKIVGISKITRDITASEQAAAALAESEERFRLVANTAPMTIWVSGPDELRTYFNQGWLDFTGRTLEEEIGNGWTKSVHAEDLKECLEIYTKVFDQRKAFRMEYRVRRHDGEDRRIFD